VSFITGSNRSIIQIRSGGQKSYLKKKLQVCESQKSCWFVGDQILFFLILSLIVEVYL